MGGVLGISAPNTGYCYKVIRQSLYAGKKTPENEKVEEERRLEEITKVSPIQETHSTRRKIVGRVVMSSRINLLA